MGTYDGTMARLFVNGALVASTEVMVRELRDLPVAFVASMAVSATLVIFPVTFAASLVTSVFAHELCSLRNFSGDSVVTAPNSVIFSVTSVASMNFLGGLRNGLRNLHCIFRGLRSSGRVSHELRELHGDLLKLGFITLNFGDLHDLTRRPPWPL